MPRKSPNDGDAAADGAGVWLALELSTLAGSVALFTAEGGVLAEVAWPAQPRRTGMLFPEIAALYRTIGRSARETCGVAYSQGPGSFTGLRTACAIARMFRSAIGCHVVAVPSFEVLARAYERENGGALRSALGAATTCRIAVMRDARRGQVYAALAERAGSAAPWRVGGPRCVAAQSWLASVRPVDAVVSDEALESAAHVCGAEGERFVRVSALARGLAGAAAERVAAGAFCGAQEIVPLYVRPPECEEVFAAKRAAAISKRLGSAGSAAQ